MKRLIALTAIASLMTNSAVAADVKIEEYEAMITVTVAYANEAISTIEGGYTGLFERDCRIFWDATGKFLELHQRIDKAEVGKWLENNQRAAESMKLMNRAATLCRAVSDSSR